MGMLGGHLVNWEVEWTHQRDKGASSTRQRRINIQGGHGGSGRRDLQKCNYPIQRQTVNCKIFPLILSGKSIQIAIDTHRHTTR